MVRKCRRIAEVTLMEVAQVGVRTRARAAMEIEATRSRSRKRRKVCEGELVESSKLDVHINCRRRLEYAEENSFPRMTSGERVSMRSVCSESSSDQAPASCCSSNISGELEEKIIGLAELEEKITDFAELEAVTAEAAPSTYDNGVERTHATPTRQFSTENVSNDAESMVGKTDESSRRGLITPKTPTMSEIEEFFVCAEENLRKRFAEKYNYDIVKDEAMEGRYEWDRLKP